MKELVFVIPMKDPAKGKTRLASVLPAPARGRLALALFRQVLTFLNQHQSAHDIIVVTGSDKVEGVAEEYGAFTLREDDMGLSQAITQAANWATGRYKTICILPADLADPDSRDLEQLLSYSRAGRSITIAPSHDGGTNCLIVTPPDAIDFRYGPNSSQAHQMAASERGISCTIAPVSSFAYDIDTSGDLRRYQGKAGAKWA